MAGFPRPFDHTMTNLLSKSLQANSIQTSNLMSSLSTKKWNPLADARRGATAVEAAIILPILLWILFAMLDLGLAAVQSNSLSEAAQQICRRVSLHGAETAVENPVWGPDDFQAAMSSPSPMVVDARYALVTMPVEEVDVAIRWPDGDNQPRNQIAVELSYVHQPIVPGIMPWGALELSANSLMTIVN